MKSELTTIINTKNTFHKNTRFIMEDFLISCPFSLEYLKKKNRAQEVREWRQIGMAWYAMEYNTITKAGQFFNRDHSTVIHSLKRIQERKFDKSLEEKVNSVLDCMEFDVECPMDSGMQEINSLIYLEKLIKKKLALVEK